MNDEVTKMSANVRRELEQLRAENERLKKFHSRPGGFVISSRFIEKFADDLLTVSAECDSSCHEMAGLMMRRYAALLRENGTRQ